MENLDKCFEFALAVVKGGGEIMLKRFCKKKHLVHSSDPTHVVTETDLDIENFLISALAMLFPSHKFVAKEAVTRENKMIELTDCPTWVIDPIGSMENFLRNFPHPCISVALVINRITEIGIVYNPMLDQLFTARRGEGAHFNGSRVTVSAETLPARALIVSEYHPTDDDRLETTLENLRTIIGTVHGVRALGSSPLNILMVAIGAADASYQFDIDLWEYAAAEMIVREAGGTVIDPSGTTFDILSGNILCAAHPDIAHGIAKILKPYN